MTPMQLIGCVIERNYMSMYENFELDDLQELASEQFELRGIYRLSDVIDIPEIQSVLDELDPSQELLKEFKPMSYFAYSNIDFWLEMLKELIFNKAKNKAVSRLEKETKTTN